MASVAAGRAALARARRARLGRARIHGERGRRRRGRAARDRRRATSRGGAADARRARDRLGGRHARARRAGERGRCPGIDGRRLDDIVDYLNYVIVPAVFLVAAGSVIHWGFAAVPGARERLRLLPDRGQDRRPLLPRLPVVLERRRALPLGPRRLRRSAPPWCSASRPPSSCRSSTCTRAGCTALRRTTTGGGVLWALTVDGGVPRRRTGPGASRCSASPSPIPLYYFGVSLWLGGPAPARARERSRADRRAARSSSAHPRRRRPATCAATCASSSCDPRVLDVPALSRWLLLHVCRSCRSGARRLGARRTRDLDARRARRCSCTARALADGRRAGARAGLPGRARHALRRALARGRPRAAARGRRGAQSSSPRSTRSTRRRARAPPSPASSSSRRPSGTCRRWWCSSPSTRTRASSTPAPPWRASRSRASAPTTCSSRSTGSRSARSAGATRAAPTASAPPTAASCRRREPALLPRPVRGHGARPRGAPRARARVVVPRLPVAPRPDALDPPLHRPAPAGARRRGREAPRRPLPVVRRRLPRDVEEIGLRGRAQWQSLGGDALLLVPSLNAEPAWVAALASLVARKALC